MGVIARVFQHSFINGAVLGTILGAALGYAIGASVPEGSGNLVHAYQSLLSGLLALFGALAVLLHEVDKREQGYRAARMNTIADISRLIEYAKKCYAAIESQHTEAPDVPETFYQKLPLIGGLYAREDAQKIYELISTLQIFNERLESYLEDASLNSLNVQKEKMEFDCFVVQYQLLELLVLFRDNGKSPNSHHIIKTRLEKAGYSLDPTTSNTITNYEKIDDIVNKFYPEWEHNGFQL